MEPLSPKDPKSIGDYTLIGRLGSGGMGIVYLAADGPDSVALKVIRESLLEDPSQATRFSREIETLKKISSPYVAKIINSGVTDGQAWYATEFVNGPDLKSLVEAKGPLKGDVWMSLAKGLLQGISAIHAQGIIHRDIKPANVIIAESGPKIIDFGIAQVTDATSVTSTGLVAGTPAWFSPEQIEGKSLTVATDLFSAGSVLTYAATGKSPWGDETTMTKASVYSILVSEPNLSEVTDTQRKIIGPLLSKEPIDRRLPAGLSPEPAKGERTDASGSRE
jgi:eukaryotic-like serine/threonine-protein kinase